jgi:hypothetical protein
MEEWLEGLKSFPTKDHLYCPKKGVALQRHVSPLERG